MPPSNVPQTSPRPVTSRRTTSAPPIRKCRHAQQSATGARGAFAALTTILGLATAIPSQCTNPWLGFGGATAAKLVRLANGDIAGVQSVSTPTQTRLVVRRWNGTSWVSMGSYFSGGANPGASVDDLVVLPNGDLVVAGWFTHQGGVAGYNHVARWDGFGWVAMDIGLPYWAYDLEVRPNGQLVACCDASPWIFSWNGTTWVPFNTGGTFDDLVQGLTSLPNGDLVACGWFTNYGNFVARWNGSAWSAMGSGMDSIVSSVLTLPNGNVVASGSFAMAGGVAANNVALWNGNAWSAMPGTPWVLDSLPLPNGEVLLGGLTPGSRLVRWNGSVSTPVPNQPNGAVGSLLALPSGEVLVSGSFSSVGATPMAGIARLSTTCPALAVHLAAGCPSSGGANLLTVTSLPWTGGSFRSQGTGLPSSAFIAAVTGFSTTFVPLASLFPQGQPGCNLHVTPDLVDLLLSNAGSAEAILGLPNVAALVGGVFHHQMIPLEVDASLNIVAITATNALSQTIGAF